ncbi:hypothetical protein X975_13654, partial [Stegodyphus mimosarum]
MKHRQCKNVSHVDALSPSPVDQPEETLDSITENNLEVYLMLTIGEQILMIQHSDPELRNVIDILKEKINDSDRMNAEKYVTENYILKNNRLFRKLKDRE